MQNVKFRCILALFASDAKNKKTIQSSIVFTRAKYIMPLEQLANSIFCCAKEYVRLLFSFFLTSIPLCPSHRLCVFQFSATY